MNREWKRLILAACLLALMTAAGALLPDVQTEVTDPPIVNDPITKPVEDPNTKPNPKPIEDPPITTPKPNPEPEPEETPWYLLLVNRQNPISLDFEPEELASVDGYYEMDSRVVPHMQAMIAAAESDGIRLRLVSGYRDANLQQYLYQQEIQSYVAMGYSQAAATEEAGKWVAIPGTSEHQTGLAADIVSAEWLAAGQGLTESFAEDVAAVWLKNHCMNYGFVLRYPKDKTEMTGIGFEPWHYRYVGTEVAKAIMDQGLCLEEYFNLTP